jgi:hypothetical protein
MFLSVNGTAQSYGASSGREMSVPERAVASKVGMKGAIIGLAGEWWKGRAEARAVARSLQSELADNESKIEEALARGERWPGQMPPRVAQWREHQKVMARYLPRG